MKKTEEFQCHICDKGKTGSVGIRLCCFWCGQIFRRKYDMKRHIGEHTRDEPYQCGACAMINYWLILWQFTCEATQRKLHAYMSNVGKGL